MPYFHGTFQTFMKEISAIWHVNGNANKCSWKLACLHWIHFTKIIALPFHLWMKNTINKIFMKPKRVRQVGPKLKICKTCCGFLILVHVSFLCSILSAVFFLVLSNLLSRLCSIISVFTIDKLDCSY